MLDLSGATSGALVSATLACADPLNLQRDMDALLAAGVQLFHMDVMDGHYVPNLCMNLDQVAAVARYGGIPTDVHLMVERPLEYVERLAESGVQYVAFHPETTTFPFKMIGALRERGIKAGAAWNPGQAFEWIEALLPELNYVLCMTVEPGFSGQSFRPDSQSRLQQLQQYRQDKGLSFAVMVDGGVDAENGLACLQAGANALVGGAFACFNDPADVYTSTQNFIKALSSFRRHA